MSDADCPSASNASFACVDGTCAITCSTGFADCDGSAENGCEVTLSSDADNCGVCGNECGILPNATARCVEAACEIDECIGGFSNCDGDRANGCETDFRSPLTCGDCRNRCLSTAPICNTLATPFACVPDCGDEAEVCAMACVDVSMDVQHCGECGNECPRHPRARATCDGSCGSACEDGYLDCNGDLDEDGCETDITSSLLHCGACDQPCSGMGATWSCTASACEVTACTGALRDCDGSPSNGCEADTASSNTHCGACDSPCADGCVDGICDPIVKVAGSFYHTCLLRTSGRIQCWGRNQWGELGVGTHDAQVTPTVVLASGGAAFLATDITVAEGLTCAIGRVDSKLYCWGSNSSGRRGGAGGAGVTTDVPDLVLSDDVGFDARTFRSVESRSLFVCAIDDADRVWCWGYNQTGVVTETPSSFVDRATRVNLDVDVVEIGVGSGHVCARLMDQTVRCWGRNAWGQCGIGITSPLYEFPGIVTVPADVGLTNVVGLMAGAGHACATTSDGAVSCWGQNIWRELALPLAQNYASPTESPLLMGATQLSGGFEFSCGFLDGENKCWGRRQQGQLGDGGSLTSPDRRQSPEPVAGVDSDFNVRAFQYQACGFRGTEVRCWGGNEVGQSGQGHHVLTSVTPVGMPALSAISALSAGDTTSCGIASGALYCWGLNSFGSGGGVRATSAPTPISGFGSMFTDVATAYQHACAVIAGDAYCWGNNMSGRLGDGTFTTRTTPTMVALAGNEDSVAVGIDHSCALQATSLYCWGRNTRGQLGRDTAGASDPTPGLFEGVGPVTHVAISDAHGHGATTCVVTGGEVHCVGRGIQGELGNGTLADSTTPVRAGTLTSVLDLDAGNTHFCAVEEVGAGTGSGQVHCWGTNTFAASTPVIVPGVTDATAVAVGALHSCAVRATGAVVCWGEAGHYQTGDGTHADALSGPVEVIGITNAVDVTAGGLSGDHTCAILDDGTATCWGFNEYGACGDGNALHLTAPQIVVGL